MKICPIVNKFAKVGSQFGQILNIFSRNGRILFKFCMSGKSGHTGRQFVEAQNLLIFSLYFYDARQGDDVNDVSLVDLVSLAINNFRLRATTI